MIDSYYGTFHFIVHRSKLVTLLYGNILIKNLCVYVNDSQGDTRNTENKCSRRLIEKKIRVSHLDNE